MAYRGAYNANNRLFDGLPRSYPTPPHRVVRADGVVIAHCHKKKKALELSIYLTVTGATTYEVVSR